MGEKTAAFAVAAALSGTVATSAQFGTYAKSRDTGDASPSTVEVRRSDAPIVLIHAEAASSRQHTDNASR